MIPLKLKLRNFMCYQGDVPALDFTGIHTACISGDNGNGKSALIDAMTWALWGKSRARKTDDDLISLGKEEMEVEFDFAVSKQVYRIVRKHSRPKKATASGQSILEFQIDQGDGFKPLTGNSIGDTQQRIVNVVHMDYDTFINSALILQGRADEFTLKAPAKRTEVLSEILGFSYYDALAQDASDLARAAESVRGQLEKDIANDTIELAGREPAEADLERTTRELAASGSAIETQGNKLEDLKRQKEALEAKEGELKTIDSRLADNRRIISHLQTEQARHEVRIREFDALMNRRLEIELSYTELKEKRKSDADMNQKLRDSANLNERKHRLDMKIEVLKQELLRRHDLAANKIAEFEEKIAKQPELRREQQKSQDAQVTLTRKEKELSEKRQSLDEIRATLGGLKQTAAQLEQKTKEIEEKITLLKDGGERCPLCGSEIGEIELRTILSNYTNEKAKCLDDLKSSRIAASVKQKELEMQDKEVRSIELSLNKERPGIQAHAGVIEKELTETEEAKEKLAAEKETLGEIEQQIARREFAATEEKLLSDTLVELSRLNYDETAHRDLQKRVVALEPYADLKRRLEEADRLAGAEKEAFTRTGETIREMNAAISADTRRRDGLASELFLLPKIRSDVTAAEKERLSLLDAERRIEAALYSIKAKLERFAELEKRRAEKRVEFARAAEEEKIYKDLMLAFGKKGVQQMFIEAAIPEIEVEANKLLSRMTDNRMHLKIDTLRQSRRGDALETLDINISDELGTRSYEMYSGGEAFRINFAIRIALSKILARRAGAPLPTLIIDEGFGTQDATGIEKIKEAISAIQDDFERILVITHIEELRDAFPNRIDVVKGPNGSTIEMT
jgi:exonuclease SbcC